MATKTGSIREEATEVRKYMEERNLHEKFPLLYSNIENAGALKLWKDLWDATSDLEAGFLWVSSPGGRVLENVRQNYIVLLGFIWTKEMKLSDKNRNERLKVIENADWAIASTLQVEDVVLKNLLSEGKVSINLLKQYTVRAIGRWGKTDCLS